MRTIKNICKILAGIVAVISATACDDFFELPPTNEMVLDEFWQSEDDVLSVTMSCYRAMQESDFLKRLIVWGEFRSDNMRQGPANGDENLRYIANLNILPSNGYSSWGNYYNVINLCNTVEHFAPGVCEKDPNFTPAKLNAYLAEVKGIRAYCYFVLIRAFRDIPFSVTPVIDDTEEFSLKQSEPDEILDFLIEDLIKAEPMASTTYANRTYTKGRITQAAVRTLIADMCLWRGRYEDCITYCDKVLNDKNNVLSMENSLNYCRSIFIDGLSSETIFELQFLPINYANSAVADFYGEMSLGYSQQIIPYDFTTSARSIFTDTDLRLRTSLYSTASSGASIRKYTSYLSGSDLTSSSVNNSNYHFIDPTSSNWVVYRLPEVYLMKAEALTELNQDLQTAFELACISYDRANPEAGIGSLNFDNYNTPANLLDFIYDERQREFLFEGKRYFDILRRITHHRDQFKNLVNSYLMVKYDDLDQSTVSSKLSAFDALYMPINASEMRANGLLVQNPFYKTSTDITSD